MTLKEKNDVLRLALGNINYIFARHVCSPDGSIEEQYERNSRAFYEIAKIIANARQSCLHAESSVTPFVRTLRIPVIHLPDASTLAYIADDPGLPRLTAAIASCSNNTQQECKIYIGKDVLAKLTVYRNRSFAVRMVRSALKGAMSCLGKRRRQTANRQSREAAKQNNPVNPVNPV